jgi:hypothetical protein
MSTIETVNFLVLMMTLFMVCLRVSIATTIPGISNLLRSYLIYLMGLPFIGDNILRNICGFWSWKILGCNLKDTKGRGRVGTQIGPI